MLFMQEIYLYFFPNLIFLMKWWCYGESTQEDLGFEILC